MENSKKNFRLDKKEKKKAGNRDRRNFFKRQLAKNPEEAHWDEFDIVYNSTKDMNGVFKDSKRKKDSIIEEEE